MGIQFPRVISRRYNDRILHDDEEKSEIGKGISRGYYFLASNFFFFHWIYFQTFVTFVIVLFPIEKLLSIHAIDEENIFLTFFRIDIYFYKPIILLEPTNHIQRD